MALFFPQPAWPIFLCAPWGITALIPISCLLHPFCEWVRWFGEAAEPSQSPPAQGGKNPTLGVDHMYTP